MKNIKSQTFTDDQLEQHIKSTYEQSIRQYSRLTKSKKHRQQRSIEVSDTMQNELHAIENVAAT